MKAIDELRSMRGNYATYEDLVARCCELADAIERELEERYIEGPNGADGRPVRYGGYVKVYPYDGSKRKVKALRRSGFGWKAIFEDGDEESLYRVVSCEPPTVEDVLREFALACEDAGNAGPEVERIASEFAERLQLRERDDG